MYKSIHKKKRTVADALKPKLTFEKTNYSSVDKQS